LVDVDREGFLFEDLVFWNDRFHTRSRLPCNEPTHARVSGLQGFFADIRDAGRKLQLDASSQFALAMTACGDSFSNRRFSPT